MQSCINCGVPLMGRYCYQCGQKYYSDKDKSVKSIIGEVFHFITHFEGKFFTTIKTLFSSPGRLSVDYSRGLRQKYYKPISLYLLLVIIYLLFPIFGGLNISMKYYKNITLSGHLITRQIQHKMEKENISETLLTEKFEQKSRTTSKFLLFLLIPLSALVLHLLYFNKKRWWYDDFITATEINIFYLLGLYLIFPMIYIPIIHLFHFNSSDNTTGIFLSFIFIFYLSVLFRNVFVEKWWKTILKSFLFVFIYTFVLMIIFRTIVFEVTFMLT